MNREHNDTDITCTPKYMTALILLAIEDFMLGSNNSVADPGDGPEPLFWVKKEIPEGKKASRTRKHHAIINIYINQILTKKIRN